MVETLKSPGYWAVATFSAGEHVVEFGGTGLSGGSTYSVHVIDHITVA